MIRNVSGQPIGANIRDATTGAPYAGTVTVYIKGDLTPQFQGTVGGGVAANNTKGYFEYVPAATETDFNHIAFTFDGPGAVGATIQIETITPSQVSALQSATGIGAVLAQDVVTDALTDIRVARAGDVVAPEQMAFGMNKLNRLLDRWNANPRARFTTSFTPFTMIPNHQPHSIGPNSADFAMSQRPVRISGANIILTGSNPVVRTRVAIRDDAWWLQVPVQGISTPIPSSLYYSADWPNGNIFLWPVPTVAYQLELLTDVLFGVFSLQDTFWLPYGYRDAISLTLAEELAPGFGQTASPALVSSASEARGIIFGNNDDIPYIATADSGLQHAQSGNTFNWIDRSTL